jgi:dibenzofuran dioxygenase alpha subunit
MASLEDLVRPDGAMVSRQIFTDPEIYAQELDSIFAHCWLYLGHESQIRTPGDYITTYMAEDPVILCRDQNEQVRAFLNSCPHRGMKVCQSDAGNSKFFRCAYHGWTFANDGKLTGVPRLKDAYYGELAVETLGLIPVPRVESYRGFVFGCWDPHAVSLKEYLGDFTWYFDIVIERNLGELEVASGMQRYRATANWKVAADNFAGDDYHVLYTHASSFKLGLLPPYDTMGEYNVYFPNGHGMGDLPKLGQRYQDDLYVANQLGPEAVEYVQELYHKLERTLSPRQVEIFALGEGNIFPNFSWNDFSAFHGVGLFQWHPRGPHHIEVWETYAFDSQAPKVIKDIARVQFSQEQAAAGFFGQDDSGNFEQVTASTRGHVSKRYSYDYTMGIGHEGEIQVAGLPGNLGPHYSEQNQRNFYRTWLKWMSRSKKEALR